jgi:hypothetical protein
MILKHVMFSAAEAEIGSVFLNAKEAIFLRTTSDEIGHPLMSFIYTSAISHDITKVMGLFYYLGSVLRQSTHARAHSLVEWLSGRLDLSVRMCARSWGCGSGSSLAHPHRT